MGSTKRRTCQEHRKDFLPNEMEAELKDQVSYLPAFFKRFLCHPSDSTDSLLNKDSPLN